MAKVSKKDRELPDAAEQADNFQLFQQHTHKIPQGVPLFNIGERKKLRLSFGLWTAGKHNRLAKVGSLTWNLPWDSHRVGVGGDAHVCPKTVGKPCPICEKLQTLPRPTSKEDKEAIEARRPYNVSTRFSYWVWDHDEPEKGWQFWRDIAHSNLQAHINTKLENADEKKRDRWKHHMNPAKGYILELGGRKKDGGGFKFLEFSDITFEKREESLGTVDEVLEELDAHGPVESWLNVLSYDDLKEMMNMGKVTKEQERRKSKKKVKGGRQDDDDDDTDDEDEDDEDDEDTDDDEDEDEPKPKKKPGKSAKKSSRKSKDDDDDEDEDSDEESDDDDDDDEESDDEDDEDRDDDVGEVPERHDILTVNVKGKKLKGECTNVRPKKKEVDVKVKGKVITVKDKDVLKIEKPEDDDDEEEDDEDDSPKTKRGKKPAKTSKASSKKSKKDEDDDDDEDDEEDDDEDDEDD